MWLTETQLRVLEAKVEFIGSYNKEVWGGRQLWLQVWMDSWEFSIWSQLRFYFSHVCSITWPLASLYHHLNLVTSMK